MSPLVEAHLLAPTPSSWDLPRRSLSPGVLGTAQLESCDLPTKSVRANNSNDITKTSTTANLSRRRSSLGFSLPGLVLRRYSLPNVRRPFMKSLNPAQRALVTNTLDALELSHRKTFAKTEEACNRRLRAMQTHVDAIVLDIERVLNQTKHCSHRNCVQKQLNLAWRKYERSCLIADRYGELLFKFIRERYTQAWLEGQACIGFDAGNDAWFPARQQLSNLRDTSSRHAVHVANKALRAAYKRIKTVARVLARAQKTNEQRPLNGAKRAIGEISREIDNTGMDVANGSHAECEEATQPYIVKYCLRMVLCCPENILYEVFVSKEKALAIALEGAQVPGRAGKENAEEMGMDGEGIDDHFVDSCGVPQAISEARIADKITRDRDYLIENEIESVEINITEEGIQPIRD